MNVSPPNILCNKIESSFLKENNIELYLQREDLLHPQISGNKWRKLKYNIQAFKAGEFKQIVTFGGTFSNHIAATAAAGKEFNIKTIGIIRGEENAQNNPTLTLATKNGMELVFVNRLAYKNKNSPDFISKLQQTFPNSLMIPEGGSNFNALMGCAEICNIHPDFDTVFCACGTGATLAGIISSLTNKQKAIGIPVLKNANFLSKEVQTFLSSLNNNKSNWELNFNYHLGGYAKNNLELNCFIGQFYKDNNIKLDPIYTGKMMFALYDLIKNKGLRNQKVLAIHTGGLQGIQAYEERYKLKLFD